jgi:hypothetical protein
LIFNFASSAEIIVNIFFRHNSALF